MNLTQFVFLDKAAETPVYLQLVQGVVAAIQQGQLPKGMKLDSSRHLAAQLRLHRKTVQHALEELEAQGWLTILPRKGVFIAQETPNFRPKNLLPNSEKPLKKGTSTGLNFTFTPHFSAPLPSADVQFSDKLILMEGFPDIRLSPLAELMREIRSIEKKTIYRKYFQYGNPQGAPHLRETLAQYLRETRGLAITPDHILITRGAQMGIYLAAQLLIQPGDVVVVGDPGYMTATATFAQTGAHIVRIPVDDFGVQVDEIETLCQTRKIRAVYVIPHHHQPTTVTLRLERRLKLLSLAAEHHFAIIEDDYDYDFHYSSSPMLPIASLDTLGNAIYIGTLSKTLAPAIRVGFMVAPPPFVHAATHLRRRIDFQGDSVMEVALADLYKRRDPKRHQKNGQNVPPTPRPFL
jgi:GntR family transcriptional regulator / MocR family aminotransferase